MYRTHGLEVLAQKELSMRDEKRFSKIAFQDYLRLESIRLSSCM